MNPKLVKKSLHTWVMGTLLIGLPPMKVKLLPLQDGLLPPISKAFEALWVKQAVIIDL